MKGKRVHANPQSSKHPDPFPMHKLKRVDKPTTRIVGKVERVDEREGGLNRATRGDFGSKVQQERFRFVQKHPISASLAGMTANFIDTVDGPVAPQKAPLADDPAVLTRHIKEFAYFLRSDLVGICELPGYAVYSHDKEGNGLELNHRYAICILVDQDYKTFNGSTGHDWISNSQSFLAYSHSAFISCIVASYIRKLGYPARAHHARNYQVVVPPILLWAGMGEMCRIGGAVLNPFLGPRFKAAVVTTDLPLVSDKPVDFGLQSFCSICKKCARECPAGAIPDGGKTIYNGYEDWRKNVEACTRFRVLNPNGAGCGRCIKVCPWNKADTLHHRASIWAVRHSVIASRILLWLDDILGYGRPGEKDRWWFDLEDVNREPGQEKYVVPTKHKQS